jgi:hypothetical protein
MTTHTMFGMGVIDTCPDCQSHDLCAVHDGRGTHFFCNSCAACWTMSLGWVRRVNPLTCAGCNRRTDYLAKQAAEADAPAQLPLKETPTPAGKEASK